MEKIFLTCRLVNTGLHLYLGLLGIAGLLLGVCVPVMAGADGKVSENPAVREKLESIVVSRIAFYANHFPDMDFVVLDSGGNVEKNMHALHQILGDDPVPLDYAHPPELRFGLLMSTYLRIQFLLNTDVGSATLFASGKGARARRKYVCIVTLNPWAIARDDRAATRHLLDIPSQEFNAIPRSHYLDHFSHLLFSLDHEVFHCLDTRINGPIPMSKRSHWGDYQMLRNEDGADAFAILMQMASHGRVTAYTRRLKMIRCLSLFSGDPDHYTYPAIEAALHENPDKLKPENVRHCIQLATQIRNDAVGSYEDYLRYFVAAEHAMVSLGVSQGLRQSIDARADPVLVDKLIVQIRDAYRKLTGHALPVNRN